MRRGPPGLESVECLVSQLDLTASESGQQVRRCRSRPLSSDSARTGRIWGCSSRAATRRAGRVRGGLAGAVVEKAGELVGHGAAEHDAGRGACPRARSGRTVGDGEPRAIGADRAWSPDRTPGSARSTRSRGRPADLQCPVVAGAADVPIWPVRREEAESAATGAGLLEPPLVLLVGASRTGSCLGQDPGRAGSQLRDVPGVGPGRSSVAVRLTPAFSAVVATRSAGVQPRMSHER